MKNTIVLLITSCLLISCQSSDQKEPDTLKLDDIQQSIIEYNVFSHGSEALKLETRKAGELTITESVGNKEIKILVKAISHFKKYRKGDYEYVLGQGQLRSYKNGKNFFLRDGSGELAWQMRTQSGNAKDRNQHFMSSNFRPAELAITARLLRSSENNSFDLVPSGSVSSGVELEKTLKCGAKSAKVTLVGLNSVHFQPMFVWLKDNRLFAHFNWYSTIEKGFEGCIGELKRIEHQEKAKALKQTALRSKHHNYSKWLITDARIFDVHSGKVSEPQDILIENERISFIGQYENTSGHPEISFKGKTLVPGLIDLHAHLEYWHGPLYLLSGVTTIQDTGNYVDRIVGLRKIFDNDELATGPRVEALGILNSNTGWGISPEQTMVETVEEAKIAAEAYINNGFKGVKIYSSFKHDLLQPVGEHAKAKGYYVAGHLPNEMSLEKGLELGIQRVIHGQFFFLDAFCDLSDECELSFDHTHAWSRTLLNTKVGEIDVANNTVIAKRLDQMLSSGASFSANIATQEHVLLGAPNGLGAPYWHGIHKRIPQAVVRNINKLVTPSDSPHLGQYHKTIDNHQKLVQMAYRKGIKLAIGTDPIPSFGTLPGWSLIRELELYTEKFDNFPYEITAHEALQVATIDAARILNLENDLGSIEVGKQADFLVISGSPLDFNNLKHSEFVSRRGHLFDTHKLRQQLGIK